MSAWDIKIRHSLMNYDVTIKAGRAKGLTAPPMADTHPFIDRSGSAFEVFTTVEADISARKCFRIELRVMERTMI